jgi:hypothetical protein
MSPKAHGLLREPVDDVLPDQLSRERMADKVLSFFRTSWFPAVTLVWLIMSSSWEKVFAFREQNEEIKQLKLLTAPIPEFASAIKANAENAKVQQEDLSELKKAYFQQVHNLSIMQRNVDRMSWVLEAIAEKNGIKVPPPIEK